MQVEQVAAPGFSIAEIQYSRGAATIKSRLFWRRNYVNGVLGKGDGKRPWSHPRLPVSEFLWGLSVPPIPKPQAGRP
ncbi:MAG TPA: hypothetical protein DCE44_25845 [Verrucomicrobiales bacterium]|nr:hypothetical protein [Verrucomicrobiales bacterium]